MYVKMQIVREEIYKKTMNLLIVKAAGIAVPQLFPPPPPLKNYSICGYDVDVNLTCGCQVTWEYFF